MGGGALLDRLRGLTRLGLVGLGVAGAGVAGGVAAEHALARRIRAEPESVEDASTGVEAATERVLVMSDGARLRVLEAGRGRPIVLLHGVTLSAPVWAHQLTELSEDGFRVVALDQRGHGSSEAGSGTPRLARLAADLGEILTQLDLDDAVVVGHSLGGMVALRLLCWESASSAARHRVGALCLVATTASPLRDRGIVGSNAILGISRPLSGPTSWIASHLPGGSMPGSDLGLVATRMAFGEHPSPSAVALTQGMVGSAPARVTGPLTVEIFNFDAASRLGAIEVPTTVVVGSNDLFTPVRQAESLAGRIAGAELVILDGCGHMVMLERHAELNKVLVELAGRRRAPGTVAG